MYDQHTSDTLTRGKCVFVCVAYVYVREEEEEGEVDEEGDSREKLPCICGVRLLH